MLQGSTDKDRLLINKALTKGCMRSKIGISIEWINYQKYFYSVPRLWILKTTMSKLASIIGSEVIWDYIETEVTEPITKQLIKHKAFKSCSSFNLFHEASKVSSNSLRPIHQYNFTTTQNRPAESVMLMEERQLNIMYLDSQY